MRVLYISGHLDLSPSEFAEYYAPRIRSEMHEGAFFIVGDANGADVMAQRFLRELGCELTRVKVFHMFDSPRNNAGPYSTMGGFDSDSARDIAMTKASHVDIAWVRKGRENSGTAKNIARRSLLLST